MPQQAASTTFQESSVTLAAAPVSARPYQAPTPLPVFEFPRIKLNVPPSASDQDRSQRQTSPGPQQNIAVNGGWSMPKAEPSLARHVSAESPVQFQEGVTSTPPPPRVSCKIMAELPSEPALSMSFNVSQLLAGVDELMSLYEAMVEQRCRGDVERQEEMHTADAQESKHQCAALHKLALQGMLPPQLARMYVGKSAETFPLEDWRSTGCPGLQPEELLAVIDQLMQAYETMVKDSVQESEPQPRLGVCSLDSSLESLEKFKRLHHEGISRARQHKPGGNREQFKQSSNSISRSTFGGPSMILEPEEIARALSAPCVYGKITDEAVLPLTACAQLPCQRMISVMDKVALWSARQLSDSEPDLAQAVVRTISNSEVSEPPARDSSPDGGSPMPAERAPTPPWEACPLEDPSSKHPEFHNDAVSLGHMASPADSEGGRCQLMPDAGATHAPGAHRVSPLRRGGNSSAGSFSSSKGKMMEQVLQKLAQVELSLATERESTQELASKYENLLISRDEAHSADVKLLQDMLAKALKDRRSRTVGSTESGGTSSKRSQSRTLSSSAVSSSTGSRYGTKSACSQTPVSGSGSRVCSQKSPRSFSSPELRAKEPSPKEMSGEGNAPGSASLEQLLPKLQHQSIALPAQCLSSQQAHGHQEVLEAACAIRAQELHHANSASNDDLLKQVADAAWASRYFGLLPVAALGAILNDLLEAAPQEPMQTPRPTPRS